MKVIVPKISRVVVVIWKLSDSTEVEVYSSLKNFCAHHSKYNYNTLSNYLSKRKIPYENKEVFIERKQVISSSGNPITVNKYKRQIEPIVKKTLARQGDEKVSDLNYWLKQPYYKRIQAVSFIISQSFAPGSRMDKSIIKKKKLQS